MMHTADSLVLAVANPGNVYSEFNKYLLLLLLSSSVVVVVVLSISIIDSFEI
jgi:hypothetical protein